MKMVRIGKTNKIDKTNKIEKTGKPGKLIKPGSFCQIGSKGFSLVEVVVSLAIMAVVGGAVSAFVLVGSNSYKRGSQELTLQEEAQLTANQMIDSIIDVEKGVVFAGGITGDAVDLDGSSAIASDVPVAELRLYNEDNVYMLRWQGDDGSGYATANQVFLYEAANSWVDEEGNAVSKNTPGARVVPGNPSGSTGYLMAQYVTSFDVNLGDIARRRVVLNMDFDYQGKLYNISETIRLRNEVTDKPEYDGSKLYDWITGIKIIPEHADVNQGTTFPFAYELTGDPEAVSLGVTWRMEMADGSHSPAAGTHIDSNGILSVAQLEPVGDNVIVVTVTSVADPSMSAQATVTVKEGGIMSLAISPKDAYVMQGGTLQFSYTMEGADSAVAQGVTWMVKTVDDTVELKAGTTINASGLLRADREQKVGSRILKVTAAAKADPSKTDETFVTVLPYSNVEGKYDAKLIATNLTTYTFTDENGESKIGYKADIECLPTYADYLGGYPKIVWSETTVGTDNYPNTYNITDETQYTCVLQCGVIKNTMAHVSAEVQLDADTPPIRVGIDITIPDLKTTVDTTKPYIDSENFVLYRNGSINCEIKNYDGPVVWRFESMLGISEGDVGFDVLGHDGSTQVSTATNNESDGWKRAENTAEFLGPDFLANGSVPVLKNARIYSDKHTGKDVTVNAVWCVDWNTEYRLKIQAWDEDENNIVAESIVLIPRFDVLFSSLEHYDYVKRGTYWSQYTLKVYGFNIGYLSGGAFQRTCLEAKLVAEKELRKDPWSKEAYTQIVYLGSQGTDDSIVLKVDYQEPNDVLYVKVRDIRKPEAERILMFIVQD